MPKDEWGNIISDAEYDHIYRTNGDWYTSKDEFGNIIQVDEHGNIKRDHD
jgi:hypothetical protein